jgi:HAMP domain-containing protein
VGFVGVLLGLQGLYGLILWVICRVLLWVVAFGLVGALSELGSFLGAFRRS